MPTPTAASPTPISASPELIEELVSRYGEPQRVRLERGCRQVSQLWRPGDGDAQALANFIREHFVGTQDGVDALFSRFERILEQLNGHMIELWRTLAWDRDVDTGPVQPIDALFAGYWPGAHLGEDLFANKIAFVALLNFPVTTLKERAEHGESWTRRQWAEARLTRQFATRIPADAQMEASRRIAEIEGYTSAYNIWMHQVLTADGRRLFPARKKLISHWGLRDELKAAYKDPVDGLAKQRIIAQVMDRIVTQTVPAAVIDNPGVDWEPFANTVSPSPESDATPGVKISREAKADREPDTRYAMLLSSFRAAQAIDRHSPNLPTRLRRSFDEDREISEARVREMFEQVLGSPLAVRVGAVVEKRLGRPLEPFDIWFNGFRVAGAASHKELDPVTTARYPTAAAFEKDLPNLLQSLGFTEERAKYLATYITVDGSRGSGHAAGGGMRFAKARLRTRVGPAGMDYQGYNIATHELGHNVEQVLSMNDVDHTLLAGVPNNAFTEAMAFVFQARDLEMLGRPAAPDPLREANHTLDEFWVLFEISGVALLDIEIWNWMYAHPDATPAQLREGVLGLARDLWNRYYAPVFKTRDVPLLAIYAHLLGLQLYTPDYAVGHMISFQIEAHLRAFNPIAPELERMVRFGSVSPDLWMKHATGDPVSPDAVLAATARALEKV